MSSTTDTNQTERFDDLVARASLAYRRHFGGNATIGACAPGRVNLIGEHTDYTQGYVLPMAIQLSTLVIGASSDTGLCRILTLAEEADDPKLITFPVTPVTTHLVTSPQGPKWANYIKGTVVKYRGEVKSFNAVVVSSVPFGKGLSSSASMQVALYTFLDKLTQSAREDKDQKISHNVRSPTEDQEVLVQKALACLEGEQLYAGLPCGIMDQYISFLGRQGHALFIDCRSLESTPVSMENPNIRVLVCDSNIRHELTSSEYTPRQQQCTEAATILGVTSLRDATLTLLDEKTTSLGNMLYKRARHVISENKRTLDTLHGLQTQDYTCVGTLMLESHISLRDDFEVSCPELDQLVTAACEVTGVYGSRMTGGGFGGCTVTLVKTDMLATAMDHIKERYDGTVTFYICRASSGARFLDAYFPNIKTTSSLPEANDH